MRFGILGPLVVCREGGDEVALGGLKQRALLALLLLANGRPVGVDHLLEAIWNGRPPPRAHKSIQGFVSALRSTLGAERIATVGRAYALLAAPEEVDLREFVALSSRAAAAAPPEQLASLEAALALVRGEPLLEFADFEWAREERARLDEVIGSAAEARFDAALELGRHRELVPELELAVAANPDREHLVAQLMIALYRSGRQADALAAYRSMRARLDEDLGLMPSPRLRQLEQSILQHDRALEHQQPAVLPVPESSTGRVRHRRRIIGLTLACAAAILVAAAAARTTFERGGHHAAISGNAVALVSSGGGATASANLGAAPTRLALGAGSLWVTEVDADVVARVDLATRTVRQTIPVGHGPAGVAFARGDVWVANADDGTVSRIDPSTNTVVQKIAVGAQPSSVIAADGGVWVTDEGDDNLLELDASSGRCCRRIVDVGRAPVDVVAQSGSLWVANHGDGTVSRVDPSAGEVTDIVRVGDGPAFLTATPAGVWVADDLDSTVSRIDPRRDAVTSVAPTNGTPAGLVAWKRTVLVSATGDHGLSPVGDAGDMLAALAEGGDRIGPLLSARNGLWFGADAGGDAHRGGTLRVVTSSPQGPLDPAIDDQFSPLQALGLTNDGLVTLDHAGGAAGTELVPDLAVALPRPSQNGTTYVVRLRRGIAYSTGGDVNASDVRHTFERLFDVRSPGRSLYEHIRGARACLRTLPCSLRGGVIADDAAATVTFHLTAPDPTFLYKLTEPYAYVLPRSAPDRPASAPLPATGPYRIAPSAPANELRLVRNPRFHEWSTAAQPDGYPDVITWRLGVSPAAALRAAETGRADLTQSLSPLTPAELRELDTRYPSRRRSAPVMGTNFYFLNTRVPPFDELGVRRALNFAIDRHHLVELVGGDAVSQPTCQILPPRMPGYRRYCPYTTGSHTPGRRHGPNLAKARRLVAGSGSVGERVTIWDSGGPNPVDRYLVSVLRRLGYRARARFLPDSAFLAYTDDSRHRAQIVSGGWSADWPAASSLIGKLTCASFIPNSVRTFDNSEFCDPAIDRQISRAEELDLTDRAAAERLWQRLDRTLTNEAIWLPTLTSKQTDVLSARAGDYQYNPFWGTLVDQLWVR